MLLRFIYYRPHAKRGQEAFDEIGILPNFTGGLVHDHWKAYFNYECHQYLCNSHHLRELTFVHEIYHQVWAKKMKDHLVDIKNEVEKHKIDGKVLPDSQKSKFNAKYSRIIREGIMANPPPVYNAQKKRGRKKKSKPLNLLERLKKFKFSVLGLMYDPRVPFDNNQSERDIRMLKVKMKISGLFRSFEGAENFCRIRSFISTVKKQNLNILEQIYNLLSGQDICQQFN